MPKRKDLLLIVGALCLALILFLISRYMGSGDVSTVVARVNGEEVLRKSLLTDGRYEIPLGEGEINIIRVEKGVVWMEEANCRDGLCIGQGKMRNRAKSIVCLPHNLVITLEGEPVSTGSDTDELDVIIY
ncbi:MAG: NusG domain II-containing protein [Clostridia bacterium]|nr:NusG domain II-containing protein [Clostridia bacterium]